MLTGNEDSVPVDLPYNIQKDQISMHVAYDGFGLRDRTDMAKVFENVMKAVMHEHMFRLAL